MADFKARAKNSIFAVGLGLVFLFGLVLVSPPARAQGSYDLERQRLHEEFVKEDPSYELSVQLCQGNGEAFAMVYESARNEALRLLSSPAQVVARGHYNGYIPPEVKLLLDSEAFELAMRTCENRVAVIERMRTADTNGKIVGLSGVAAMYVGLRMGFSRLGAKAATSQAAAYTVNTVYGLGFVGMVYQLHQIAVMIASQKIEKAKAQAEVDKTNAMLRADRVVRNQEMLESHQRELAQIELQLKSGLISENEIPEAKRRSEALRRVIARRTQAVSQLH